MILGKDLEIPKSGIHMEGLKKTRKPQNCNAVTFLFSL